MASSSRAGCSYTNGYGDSHPDYAEVVLVRHGPTAANPDILLGQLQVDLNQDGINHATAVAETLSMEREVSAVYCSDLRRAFDTARIITIRCGLEETIMIPDLKERHLGILDEDLLSLALGSTINN